MLELHVLVYAGAVRVQLRLVVCGIVAALDQTPETLVPKVDCGHVLLVVDLLVRAVVTKVALEPGVLGVHHLDVVVQPILTGSGVATCVALVRLLLQVNA